MTGALVLGLLEPGLGFESKIVVLNLGGIMEKKMETIGIIGRLCRDNGKENGSY